MIHVATPEELKEIAEALVERGATGFLLTGGLDRSGKVPLAEFAGAIEEIKQCTELKINAHVGLMPREEIEMLVGTGIDSFSVDVYGSDETVRDVLGLQVGVDRYLQVLEDLIDAGARSVSPHICIGIDRGRLKGEMEAIARLRPFSPGSLVLISLVPTHGTAFGSLMPPSPPDILSVIRTARSELPRTKLLLGCMRSKKDRSWELLAVEDGVDGIVLPSQETVAKLRARGYSVRKRATCCAIP